MLLCTPIFAKEKKMPKVKTTTVTATKLSSFYGWSEKTIRKWKKSQDIKEQNIYNALCSYYLDSLNEYQTISSDGISVKISKKLFEEISTHKTSQSS